MHAGSLTIALRTWYFIREQQGIWPRGPMTLLVAILGLFHLSSSLNYLAHFLCQRRRALVSLQTAQLCWEALGSTIPQLGWYIQECKEANPGTEEMDGLWGCPDWRSRVNAVIPASSLQLQGIKAREVCKKRTVRRWTFQSQASPPAVEGVLYKIQTWHFQVALLWYHKEKCRRFFFILIIRSKGNSKLFLLPLWATATIKMQQHLLGSLLQKAFLWNCLEIAQKPHCDCMSMLQKRAAIQICCPKQNSGCQNTKPEFNQCDFLLSSHPHDLQVALRWENSSTHCTKVGSAAKWTI